MAVGSDEVEAGVHPGDGDGDGDGDYIEDDGDNTLW